MFAVAYSLLLYSFHPSQAIGKTTPVGSAPERVRLQVLQASLPPPG
jgi:hypothetical protein